MQEMKLMYKTLGNKIVPQEFLMSTEKRLLVETVQPVDKEEKVQPVDKEEKVQRVDKDEEEEGDDEEDDDK